MASLQDRFAMVFAASVDNVWKVAQFESFDEDRSWQGTVDVFSHVWSEFPRVSPSDVDGLLASTTHKLIRRIPSGVSLMPDVNLVVVPKMGEWSPLRPSDAFTASVLIGDARKLLPDVDWVLLSVLSVLGVQDSDWVSFQRLGGSWVTDRLQFTRLVADAGVTSGILSRFSPCVRVPPFHISDPTAGGDHAGSCDVCAQVLAHKVPTGKLIQGQAFRPLTDPQRNQLFLAVLS